MTNCQLAYGWTAAVERTLHDLCAACLLPSPSAPVNRIPTQATAAPARNGNHVVHDAIMDGRGAARWALASVTLTWVKLLDGEQGVFLLEKSAVASPSWTKMRANVTLPALVFVRSTLSSKAVCDVPPAAADTDAASAVHRSLSDVNVWNRRSCHHGPQ